MEPIHIADIAKNKTEIIRVEITEYAQKKLLNIRTWYLNDANEYAPTKKGIAIALDKTEDLRKALDKVHEIKEQLSK